MITFSLGRIIGEYPDQILIKIESYLLLICRQYQGVPWLYVWQIEGKIGKSKEKIVNNIFATSWHISAIAFNLSHYKGVPLPNTRLKLKTIFNVICQHYQGVPWPNAQQTSEEISDIYKRNNVGFLSKHIFTLLVCIHFLKI